MIIEVKIIKGGKIICSTMTTEEKLRNQIVYELKRIAVDYEPCFLEIYVNGSLEERFVVDNEIEK